MLERYPSNQPYFTFPSKNQKVLRGVSRYHSDLLFGIKSDDKATVIAGLSIGHPLEWFYSYNNSSTRNYLYKLANCPINKHKLDAEVAVFSGNLFKLILGKAHPIYYA